MNDDADRNRIDAAADRLNREADDVLDFQSALNDSVADVALARIAAASRVAASVQARHWVEELDEWRRAIRDADPANVGTVLPGAMALVRHIEEAIGRRA